MKPPCEEKGALYFPAAKVQNALQKSGAFLPSNLTSETRYNFQVFLRIPTIEGKINPEKMDQKRHC